MAKHKIGILFLMLITNGCTYFDPEIELENKDIYNEYSRLVSEIVGFNIVESVDSHECKFIKYEAPESKLNPIFSCTVGLRLIDSKPSDIILDEAIFTRSGGKNSNFTAYLVQSKFLTITADKMFEKKLRENAKYGNN